MRRPRVTGWLVGALLFHAFGALTWFAFMAFAADAGSDHQFLAAISIGAATWLAAAYVMVWLFQSERWPAAWFVPFVWWFPSWLLAFFLAFGNDTYSPR